MRIAAIQHDIAWEDGDATRRHLEPMLAGAAAAGARLAVVTEMFATGFSLDADRIAEPEGGPTSTWMVAQAAQHGLWIYGSVPERSDVADKPRNVGVLAGPDGTVHRYAKIHPFTFADEHLSYAAGDRTVTVDVEGLRVSLFVCYDLRFADDWWPLAPSTDVYLCCANWPEARRAHWQALLQARAIENQAYVVGVNRVGEGGGLTYSGDSRIFDPLGEMLAGAARTESVLLADIDAGEVAKVRDRFRFLPDRRTGGPEPR
jgi:predicted amidohydrolase